MNQLLVHYCVDVQHPEVSGTEHLEMLQIRDKLAALAPTLSPEEQSTLAEADRTLAEQAEAFQQEIQRFLDLATYRHAHAIPPERWWWYLDVLQHVPRRAVAIPAAG
jgi:hypothetical protein